MNEYENQNGGRGLFNISLALLVLYFLAAVVISVLTYTPYSVMLGIPGVFRKELWMILFPASVFLPFACLFSNNLVHKFSYTGILGIFAFAAPVAASSVILRERSSGYIMLGCVFGLGAIVLHIILRDLLHVRSGKRSAAPLIIGALPVLLAALTLTLEICILFRGVLTQFKMLYVAPLCLATTVLMSVGRAKWELTDRLGAIRTLVWNSFAALYCGFCGFGKWAPWALFAVTVMVFGMNLYEYIKYCIKRREQ